MKKPLTDYEESQIRKQGREDQQKGEYNSPVSLWDEFTTWSSEGIERNNAMRQSYDEGYKESETVERAKEKKGWW